MASSLFFLTVMLTRELFAAVYLIRCKRWVRVVMMMMLPY